MRLVREGRIEFASNEAKAQYLQDGALRDVTSPSVIRWAPQFASIVDELERANAILRFVTVGTNYVNDPGREVLDSAEVVCMRGHGDCDAKVRLFVALCIVCGLEARTLPVFVAGRFPHIRAEVKIRGSWVVADPVIVNSTIGNLPRHPKTSWR